MAADEVRTRWSRRTKLWALGVALLALLVLVPVLWRPPTVVELRGSTTIGADLVPALAVAYLRSNGVAADTVRRIDQGNMTVVEATIPGDERPTRFEIEAAGTAAAFDPDGGHDIGMASRAATESEVSRLKETRGDITEKESAYVVALDGVAVVVNPTRAVGPLSVDQLRAMFTCRITDWSQVGAAPGPVRLFARDSASGTFAVFRDRVLGADNALCQAATVLPDNESLVERVEQTPDAIGVAAFAAPGDNTVVPVFTDRSAPLRPTAATIATESYLLFRRDYLYVFTEPEPPPAARELAEFAISPAGKKIVSAQGFVAPGVAPPEPPPSTGTDQVLGPPPPSGPPPATCADPPPAYTAFVSGAVRQAFDLRFDTGTADLDAKATRDLDEFLELARAPQQQGRSILLAGFADSQPGPDNQALSADRANATQQALTRGGLGKVTTRGFGEACPADTNLTLEGQARNRRVEVWVR